MKSEVGLNGILDEKIQPDKMWRDMRMNLPALNYMFSYNIDTIFYFIVFYT